MRLPTSVGVVGLVDDWRLMVDRRSRRIDDEPVPDVGVIPVVRLEAKFTTKGIVNVHVSNHGTQAATGELCTAIIAVPQPPLPGRITSRL